MTTFPINPDIIPWACQHLNLSQAEFARALHVSEHIMESWRTGERKPSLRQAKAMSERLLVPLGYLVMEEMPSLSLDASDFRTVGNHQVKNPSLELRATYNMALMRQAWYRDCALENEYQPCCCVGSISLHTPVQESIATIRNVLGEDKIRQNARMTWDKRFSALVEAIEEKAGIMVMRNSIVGNNSSRPLSVEEFRGFAIPDKYAPLIFINGQDSKNAQLFTLLHEVVHIFLNRGGISGQDYLVSSRNLVERYCNRLAAEYLVPSEELRQAWLVAPPKKQTETTYEKIRRLAADFQVSPMVMIISCRSLGLIDSQEASEFWRYETEVIRTKKNTSRGGGNPYMNIANRISRLFARSIIWQAESMQIQFGDAFKLLTVKDHNAMQRLAEEVGMPS